MSKKRDKAAKALLEADGKTHEAVLPYQDTAPVKAIGWASEVGDQPQLLTLCGGVLAYGLIRGRPDLTRAGARMIASHLLATAMKNFIKHRVDRKRPFAVSSKEDLKPKPGRNSSKEETSFPSGHSAGAMAVAQALSREVPAARAGAMAGAGFIALAQIPRCAHYLSDIGAGLAIGWLAEQAVDKAARVGRQLLTN